MVLRVCQSVLRDRHDAEDAFQVTFLVLARKPARSGNNSLASWLHGSPSASRSGADRGRAAAAHETRVAKADGRAIAASVEDREI